MYKPKNSLQANTIKHIFLIIEVGETGVLLLESNGEVIEVLEYRLLQTKVCPRRMIQEASHPRCTQSLCLSYQKIK